jgi:superfamily II DNA or RNA helicase
VPEYTNEGWSVGSDVFVRGRRWTVLGESDFTDCRALRLAGSDPFNPSIVRTFLLPFERPRRIGSTSITVVRPRKWLRLVQRAAIDARPFGGLFPAAAGQIDLHPYQLEPALAMLREGHTRVLIADAVGLGKTIQAGLILRQLSVEQESFRALVVVPASLREQWAAELKARFDAHAHIATATWLAHAAREMPTEISPWALPGIYICSFEFIRRPEVLRPVEDTGWDLLIVDEAHAATIGSARRAAVHAVAVRSRRIVLLTATPHLGDDDQCRSLCEIGRSDARPDRIVLFQRSREDVGIPRRRRTSLLAVTLSESERRTHRLLERYAASLCAASHLRGDRRARLLAIVLRKRALSSVSVLAASCSKRLALLEAGPVPGIVEQLPLPLDLDEMLLEDEEPETILGVPGLADVSSERRWLETIVAAAKLAAVRESKVVRLKRLLAKMQEPAIVFTEYRDTLVRLHEQLHAADPHVCLLHGGMTASERSIVQQQFNERGALLLATDAASEGLNLQHRCRTVIHFELPWSPARLEQRTGRVDRIGQKHAVHEIMLVASDTAERLVLAPLTRRAARARAFTRLGADLLDTVSESRVASAILDGTVLTLGPTSSLDAETLAAPVGLAGVAHAEAGRLTELRTWTRCLSEEVVVRDGIPAVAITARRRVIQHGVVRVYVLTLAGKGGAIVHSELVTVQERGDVGCLSTPADVRRAVRSLNLDGREAPPGLLHLFKHRIQEMTGAIERVGRALSEREHVVSSPTILSSQQLVQRGLFDRRSESADRTRVRANETIVEESSQRVHSLKSWSRTTASLRLCAILLVHDSNHSVLGFETSSTHS